MLGRIEPTSEYNTHAKTQVPECISSVISLGPPDPTTIGAEFMRALSLPPEPTPHIIFKLRQIAPQPTYLSKLQTNISRPEIIQDYSLNP
ncbi:hypothetical protein [Absidia glauca]|uniref:Uncharacterized protein n=1 Tax=Absidia glauca TaxID=4829 RepID=A0A163ISY4_ABSGL|nr:hypothetical protein [Absidia glauca]